MKVTQHKKVTKRKVKINGVEYSSVDEIPEDLRRKLPPSVLQAVSGDDEAYEQLKKGKNVKVEKRDKKWKLKINDVEYTSLDQIPEDVKKKIPIELLQSIEGDETAIQKMMEEQERKEQQKEKDKKKSKASKLIDFLQEI